MNYRRLGRCGLRVSELGLGCGNFGSTDERLGRVDAKAAREMVALCLDRGVNFFDTANYYAESASEATLGAALKGRRHEAVISTRVVGMETANIDDRTLSRSHVIRAAEESLLRLGTDHLDLYSIQDLLQTVAPGSEPPPIEEPLRALEDLVRWGKVRYVGVSDFALPELSSAVSAAQARRWDPLVCDQIHYSLVRREAEAELLPFLERSGIGAVVWSPLAAGFLTGKYRAGRPIPAGTRRSQPGIEFPHFDPAHGEAIVAALAALAARRGATPAQLALAWTLRRPVVSSLLLGARTLEQLGANLGAAGLSLDGSEAAELDTVSRWEPAHVDPRAALGGMAIDFNVDFDPRQDLLYEGLPQNPTLLPKALALAAGSPLLEGAIHFAYRDFKAAIAALERAVAQEPENRDAQLWLFRAVAYQAMTDKDMPLLRRAVSLGKNLESMLSGVEAFTLYAWRAELYTGFDLHAHALADLDTALRLRPDYGWAYAEQADIYTQQHRLEPALAACAQLFRLHPGEGWTYAIRARSFGKCGRSAEALADLDRAVELGTDLASVYAWRGEARRRGGLVREAIEDLDKAESLDAAYPLTYLWRGGARLAAGDDAGAEADLTRSLTLDPRNLLARAWRAQALVRRGGFDRAIEDLDAFHPSSPRAAWIGDWRGELDRAAASLAPLARALRGRFLLEEPDAAAQNAALADLDAAVGALPAHAWSRGWRAQARQRLGVDGARADLDAALASAPAWSWGWAWRGQHRLAAGDDAGALSDLDRSLALDPIQGEVYSWRSEALRRLGKAAPAREDRENALALGADRPDSSPSRSREGAGGRAA